MTKQFVSPRLSSSSCHGQILGAKLAVMELAMGIERFLPFLDDAEERALLKAAQQQSFGRDHLVLDKNVAAQSIYLIEHGAVRVELDDEPGAFPLAILGPGEFFGEMSFVDGAATSARVVAEEPTRLRMIDQANVERFESADPTFAGRLYRSIAAILVERLRRTSMHICLENRQV
jgi:extracellular factor (EF) 3-hydroxypalmitic acid methyl ester biosynthesis protein